MTTTIKSVVVETPTSTSTFSFRSWNEITSGDFMAYVSPVNIIMAVVFLIMGVRSWRSRMGQADKMVAERKRLRSRGFPPIDELKGFDWKTAEPVRFRPFKPKYHITMDDESAIENLNPDELILMDKNYHSRLLYRREKLKEHHDHFVGHTDSVAGDAAVREYYMFLMGTYLPDRYPKMFYTQETEFNTGRTLMLCSHVTGEVYPAEPYKHTPVMTLLETLARNFDEDFAFLLPEEDSEDAEDPKHRLEAYAVGCPSAWDPKEKLGKRLADIHGPVPGYKDKIAGSMDRYFAKIEPGQYVKRLNWSVTTNPELFLPWAGTNHAHEGDEIEELKEIDPEKTWVRVERQTLQRLPRTGAVVFGFKTYMYPLTEIKAEGRGEELAEAIEGMKLGNAPGMHFYKRGVVWGEAVKKYLRS